MNEFHDPKFEPTKEPTNKFGDTPGALPRLYALRDELSQQLRDPNVDPEEVEAIKTDAPYLEQRIAALETGETSLGTPEIEDTQVLTPEDINKRLTDPKTPIDELTRLRALARRTTEQKQEQND